MRGAKPFVSILGSFLLSVAFISKGALTDEDKELETPFKAKVNPLEFKAFDTDLLKSQIGSLTTGNELKFRNVEKPSQFEKNVVVLTNRSVEQLRPKKITFDRPGAVAFAKVLQDGAYESANHQIDLGMFSFATENMVRQMASEVGDAKKIGLMNVENAVDKILLGFPFAPPTPIPVESPEQTPTSTPLPGDRNGRKIGQ